MGNHKYLWVTHIISHLIRNPQGTILEHLESIDPDTVCTSIVVASEIEFGLNKNASEKMNKQAHLILSMMYILPPETPVDKHYGDIRAYLHQRGMPIGGNDLFIAAHSRALGLILVTVNTREFSGVPGLTIENWLSVFLKIYPWSLYLDKRFGKMTNRLK
jgi:tRNA(fMet)-specific endonuclease VapC